MIPVNWNIRMPLGYFRFFMPLNQNVEKEVPLLMGVIDPNYQRKNLGCCSTVGERNSMFETQGIL